ncbi:MFS transporter [Pseudoduganella sp. FT26W]|uniref:MFS transporter n=1 Tax=Duganella aquatilis TaxID=2666082 RepID=A0A844CZN6_9BURK|nr:MFS transporter [Duganella aquatilis]MRW84181.1 MFS transporter [Duganella aquatilis]
MVSGADLAASPRASAAPAIAAPAWLAVASLAISTFASVTTEFLPIGLLTNIAASLHVSEGTVGLMITMPGLVAALTGPLLIIASGRLDRRVVLLALSSLLVLSNVLAAMAPNLATMLLARVLLGLVVGGFWTFAPGATGHLVPAALQPRAMSYVLAGISVATIAGVPAGALLGDLIGWRAAFIASAVVASCVLVLQARVLPAMPPARAVQPRDLLAPLTHPASRLILLVALFLVAGHFTGYTYLRPMLQQVFGLSTPAVTTLLLVYGVAGFAGTFVGGQLVARNVRGTALAAALVIAVVLLLSSLAGHGAAAGTVAGAVAVFAWGAAFGLVPVAMTTWMLKAASATPEAGQALLVSFFQIAISLGALVGGLIVDGMGVVSALLAGGALAALASLLIGINRNPS